MDLQLQNLLNKYTSFDNLIQAINTFASSQSYIIVKRGTIVSNKRVLRKIILMYDWSKEYNTENWYKRETTTRKIDCLFDLLAVLKANRWIFRLRNSSHIKL